MAVFSEVTAPNLATLMYLQESHAHLVLLQYRVIAMYTFYCKHLGLELFAPLNICLDSLAKYECSSLTTSLNKNMDLYSHVACYKIFA
jgi:hypothetical protein